MATCANREFCPHCQARVEDDAQAKFCGECGQLLKPSPTDPASSSQETVPSRSNPPSSRPSNYQGGGQGPSWQQASQERRLISAAPLWLAVVVLLSSFGTQAVFYYSAFYYVETFATALLGMVTQAAMSVCIVCILAAARSRGALGCAAALFAMIAALLAMATAGSMLMEINTDLYHYLLLGK